MVAKNLSCTQTVRIQSSTNYFDPALLLLKTLSTKSNPYQSRSLSLSFDCLCLRIPSMAQVVSCCLFDWTLLVASYCYDSGDLLRVFFAGLISIEILNIRLYSLYLPLIKLYLQTGNSFAKINKSGLWAFYFHPQNVVTPWRCQKCKIAMKCRKIFMYTFSNCKGIL